MEDIPIQVEGEKEIFLTETALELMRKGKGLIYFKDLDDDIKLFEMVINIMVTYTSNSILRNLFNCWDISMRQSAAKPYIRNVQRLSKG